MNEYGMGDAPQMKTWYSVRWEYGRKDFFASFQEAFSFYIEQRKQRTPTMLQPSTTSESMRD